MCDETVNFGETSYTRGSPDYDDSIGAMHENPIKRYFNGMIDEVAIYNYALGADRILIHYNNALPDPTSLFLGLAGFGANGETQTNSLIIR